MLTPNTSCSVENILPLVLFFILTPEAFFLDRFMDERYKPSRAHFGVATEDRNFHLPLVGRKQTRTTFIYYKNINLTYNVLIIFIQCAPRKLSETDCWRTIWPKTKQKLHQLTSLCRITENYFGSCEYTSCARNWGLFLNKRFFITRIVTKWRPKKQKFKNKHCSCDLSFVVIIHVHT